MSLKTYLTDKADKIGAIGSAATGGALLGQFPQFIAQYVQRLGGHVDEAARTAIGLATEHPDASMSVSIRADQLKEGLSSITSAGTLEKLVEFVKHVDIEIAQRTYEAFTPGMTFDSDGLLYAATGLALGYGLYELGKAPIKAIFMKKEHIQK